MARERTNPMGLSLAERMSMRVADGRRQREADLTKTCGEVADPRSKYQLAGVGEVVFRRLTPQGWPVFNLSKDPTYFGAITIQGERGAAFANWARQQGLVK